MFGRFLCGTILFLISFGIFGEALSFSDFSHFASRSWSSYDLPHNNVTAFYRDESGLLWVGTVDGLARIDSKSSKIFNTSTDSAILSNKINDLSGCAGKIFVASASGISEIGDSGGKIEKLFQRHGIFDVEALGDCTLFATDGKEIFEIKSNEINKLTRTADVRESSVTTLFSDGFTFYAGFENGEVRSYGENGFSENLCNGNSFPVTAGRAAEGRIFAGTVKGEVLEIKGGKCEKTADPGTKEPVDDIDFKEGTLVFVSGGALFFAENGAVKPCGAFCSEAGSSSNVMLDGSFVWLSGTHGITLFYPGKFITLGRESGLLNEKVYALLEDNAGRVWAGTRGGGLFVYENGNFKYVKDRKGDIGRFVGGMFLNEDGKILVGTTDGIVEFMPDKPNVFHRMPADKGTVVNAVSAIFRDKKSRLWAGGSGGSVYLYSKKGWRLLRKFGDNSDFVSSIAEDTAGNLWFAASKGIWKLDEDDEFHEINHELATDVPVSLHAGSDGTVFAGTMNSGLLLIDKNLKISRVDSRKGLCSDTVLGITSDDDGNLWFASTKGVFSIPETKVFDAAKAENGSVECTVFGSVDGIRRPESTGGVQPSVLKRKNGDLWFPTLEGIAVLKKNGRETVKFDSVTPEEKPAAVEKNEEKSNGYLVWVLLFVLAAGAAVLAAKRARRPHHEPLRQPDPSAFGSSPASGAPESAESSVEDLTPEPLSSVARGENAMFDPEKDDVGEKPKYEGYQLDDEIAAAYAKEARDLMEKEKLYRNPYLTLPELAKKLKLSSNTLSQVLNGYCGQTFYNFVNTYRLEEVISMMHDPKNDDKSILKLSIEAGFNTKSTFNNIFKKQTGMTPAEFRKKIGNQEKK